MSEAESMWRLREMLERFIQRGAEAGEFRVTYAGFTADFLLHGLHGALVAVLHEHGSERERFLASAKEPARRVLGV